MRPSDDLIDAIAQGLQSRELSLREEQAVYGLDALAETRLHPLIAASIESSGLTVLREITYPGRRLSGKLSANPSLQPPALASDPETQPQDTDPPDATFEESTDPKSDRDRERCDLVLLDPPFTRIADPVSIRRRAKRVRAQSQGTLFERMGESDAAAVAAHHQPDACPPGEAFWLEVKVVAQHDFHAGVPGPNRTYASQLSRGAIFDLIKLRDDPHIRHAAVLLALFAEDERTAEHDVGVLLHRCLDRDLPISSPLRRSFPIVDRIGNNFCTLTLIPLRPGDTD